MKLLIEILEDNNLNYEGLNLDYESEDKVEFSVEGWDVKIESEDFFRITQGAVPVFFYNSYKPNLEKFLKVVPFLKDIKLTEMAADHHPHYRNSCNRIESVIREYDSDARTRREDDMVVATARNTEISLVFDLGFKENWKALDAILNLL